MAVVAGTPLLTRTRPWLAQNSRQLLRGLTLPLALGLSWWLANMPLSNGLWAALVIYAILQLGSLWFRRWPGLARVALWCSVLTDAAFALFLVGQSAVLGAAIYPLYLLLALRALSIYHELPAATITPFALGPAYLF